jgi:hypothetical protein
MEDPTAGLRPVPQVAACDRCSQGVMDAENPHLWGGCMCHCHQAIPSFADRQSLAWERVQLLLDRRQVRSGHRSLTHDVLVDAAWSWTTSPAIRRRYGANSEPPPELEDWLTLLTALDEMAKKPPTS